MRTGCQPEHDEIWGIEWPLTAAGAVAEGQCPSESGNSYAKMLIKTFQLNVLLFFVCSGSLQVVLTKLHMGYSDK